MQAREHHGLYACFPKEVLLCLHAAQFLGVPMQRRTSPTVALCSPRQVYSRLPLLLVKLWPLGGPAHQTAFERIVMWGSMDSSRNNNQPTRVQHVGMCYRLLESLSRVQ